MKKFLTITLLFLFGLGVWSVGTMLETPPRIVRPTISYRAPTKQPTAAYVAVTYRVDGSHVGDHDANLTYRNATGGTEQRAVKLPWEAKFTMKRGSFAYLSAQTQYRAGRIKVEILVGGTVWKQADSEGEYVIATCSGSVP